VVQPTFSIHLNERDLHLLEEMQIYFGDIGHIYKGQKGNVMYSVSAKKDLSLIITHFDNYPLITQKRSDYLLFRRAFAITSEGTLDPDKLQELINIRASLNRGLTPELIQAFPNTMLVPRPLVVNQVIQDPY
jgi:hypothetical protein